MEIKDLPKKYQSQAESKYLKEVGNTKNSRFEALGMPDGLTSHESKKNTREMKSCGKSKYHSTRVMIDGIMFDSMKESRFYLSLKDKEKKGIIQDLILQPEFILQPEYVDRHGHKVRPIKYVGDFQYTKDGGTVVVDVKGYRTQAYRIKKKMFGYVFPDIEFREV